MSPKIRRRKFYGQGHFILWIHPGVYKVAGEYVDSTRCPIATAIRQQFTIPDETFVTVTSNTATIGGVHYDLLGSTGSPAYVNQGKEMGYTLPVVFQRRDYDASAALA